MLPIGKVRVTKARLVFANSSDTVNTNIILTVREVAPEVPIVANVEEKYSIDILELSGWPVCDESSALDSIGKDTELYIMGGTRGGEAFIRACSREMKK